MKRSCQRHTQAFDLPVRRMISLVPTPSALNRTISARQTCLCGVLRSRASAFRRRRSAGLRVMEIPVRMRQTRMHSAPGESPPGFKCQTQSTRRANFPQVLRRETATQHPKRLQRDECPTRSTGSTIRFTSLKSVIPSAHLSSSLLPGAILLKNRKSASILGISKTRALCA
jgi:hypothetical protein